MNGDNMAIAPDDLETGFKIGTVLGSVLAAIGISKWAHKNHGDRIKALEIGKQDKSACSTLQAACPMVLQVGIMNANLNDLKEDLSGLKEDQKKLIEEIRIEFKSHNDLHLKIAHDMGGLKYVPHARREGDEQ